MEERNASRAGRLDVVHKENVDGIGQTGNIELVLRDCDGGEGFWKVTLNGRKKSSLWIRQEFCTVLGDSFVHIFRNYFLQNRLLIVVCVFNTRKTYFGKQLSVKK